MSKIVVSDASPLNYLVLIDAVELLPRLFAAVLIPPAVAGELSSADAPAPVIELVRHPPAWLEVRIPSHVDFSLGLDAGETEAIALALEFGVGAILMDERKGRSVATRAGLLTVGTLAILELAASRGWIDFGDHIDRLRGTSFRIHEQLVTDAKARLATE